MKKSDPRHTLTFISPLFKLEKMIRRSPVKLIFPFYHAVTGNPGPHMRHLYRLKSEKEFERDLDILLKHYQPVSPGSFKERSSIKAKQGFVLSFDDGLREVKEIIAPILLRKGIPAIIFLNNNFIDNKGLFYRYKASMVVDRIRHIPLNKMQGEKITEILPGLSGSDKRTIIKAVLNINFQNRNRLDKLANLVGIDFQEFLKMKKPYLDTKEIRELTGKGFYLGAHSFDHPEFYNLDASDQLNEIVKSLQDIKNRFDLDYSYFAFPFTDHGISKETMKKLFADPVHAPDATFGTAGFKKFLDIPHYQRLSMEKYKGDSARILKTEYLYYGLKKVFSRA